MYDLIVTQQNPGVNDFIFCVLKKSNISRFCIMNILYRLALTGLLPCVPEKLVSAYFKHHLGKPRAINSKWTFTSPLIGRIEISQRYVFEKIEFALLAYAFGFSVESKLLFHLKK